jgi:hypothetical protein
MGKWVRERIDSRGRRPEGRGQNTEDGGQKAAGGKQEPAVNNQQAAQGAAPPNNRTCYHGAYVQWMRLGPSALMVMDWFKHLICLNRPDAPAS